MRDWLKLLDEIDRDCVHQWEKLLKIKLNSYEEYSKVDELIGEMILEYETKSELKDAYPNIVYDVGRVLGIEIKMSKKEAAQVLRDIAVEEHQQAAFIDFDSTDDYEVDLARQWNEKMEALDIAIKYLERK